LGKGQNEDGKMEEERRVGQVANELAGQPGSIGVVVRQETETIVEPAAVFPGLNESNVKFRQPRSQTL
jgi:hypothetical protein